MFPLVVDGGQLDGPSGTFQRASWVHGTGYRV